MKVALVMAPFWGAQYPSLAVPLLAACLAGRGHRVETFDINREFYNEAEDIFRDLWTPESPYARESFIRNYIGQQDRRIDYAVDRILSARPALVGFSLYGSTVAISLEMARRIKARAPGVTIVTGGPEGASLSGRPDIDIAVRGAGEETLPGLADILERGGDPADCPGLQFRRDGGLRNSGERSTPAGLDMLPMPDFTGLIGLYDGDSVTLPIQASRGCINRCAYCGEHLQWSRYRQMSGDRIFAEIRRQVQVYRADQFIFHDSLVNGSMKDLERFCDLMIENRLNLLLDRNRDRGRGGAWADVVWLAQGIIRPEMSPAILKKMKTAGCYRFTYGIESASPRVLRHMNKRRATVADMERVLKDSHEAGLAVQINMMFGFPTETEDDFQESLAFLRRVRPYIDMVSPSISCMITKGTYLYHHAGEFGINDAREQWYWESNGGENNYAVRFDRFERFCRLAVELGLPEKLGLRRDHPDKWVRLRDYYRFAGREDKVRECDRHIRTARAGKLIRRLSGGERP